MDYDFIQSDGCHLIATFFYPCGKNIPPQLNFLWMGYSRILTILRMQVPGIVSTTFREVLKLHT